jgi:stearoyl-CoA desaturase (Delta-9 desaturase)
LQALGTALFGAVDCLGAVACANVNNVPAVAVLEAVLIGLVTSQISFVVTTVYLHRAMAHKAITLRPPVAFACRFIIWMSTGTRPRQWVAVHRKHHAHTDKEGDPHSPVIFGYSLVQFGNAVLYRRVSKNAEQVDRYAKDMPEDRWDKVLFNHALLGLALGVALLIAVFGWQIALIAAAVHASGYLLGGGAINGIGHKWGKRPHDNLATNNQWLAWLVAGEGLHNNHHALTTSSRMSLAKGEVDPGWWAVWLLVKLRWATLRHEKLAVKPSRA